jgi:hypothetical protein
MTGLTAALAEDTAQEAPAEEEYREDGEDCGAYPEFSAEGGMGVFNAANEAYVRESEPDEDGLEEDEYLSYYVNLRKVRAIQKGPDGLFAELSYAAAPHIPISSTYSEAVTGKFSTLTSFSSVPV